MLCPVSALILRNPLFIVRSIDAPIGSNLFEVLRSIRALLCRQFILVPQIVAAMIIVSFVASGRGTARSHNASDRMTFVILIGSDRILSERLADEQHHHVPRRQPATAG